MTGRLTDAERAAAGLSTPAPRLLRPAILVTIYNDLRGTKSLPLLDRLARHAAPGDLGVCIHDPPSDDDNRLAGAIRGRGLRLWYGWGVDPDTKRPVREAAATTRRRARLAAERGAEAIELNGEKAYKAPGLDALCRELVQACRDGAPGLPVGWSYFDGPETHPMPGAKEVFGSGGVDYNAPQVYAEDPGAPGLEDHHDARRRWDRAVRQHEAMVRRGIYRPELVPGAAACATYAQLHGCTPACVAWLLDRALVGRAWALPTRCDEEGLRGVEAVLLARRETGRSAGAIARWQAAHGLTADGIAGPLTLAAMGLA